MLFAQRQVIATWSLGEMLVGIVIIAACVALVYVALNKFGVSIPDWVKQVFWICLVAVVVIFALRFVLSL